MRIVAGELGGRRLLAPRGDGVRPTTDRVREALFSILGEVDGLDVLDLFAGTGALGLEALSRGARSVALIDTDSDPDLIDLPIPGNDDAMRAIELIMKEMADSVIEGKAGRGAEKSEGDQPQRRRSSRSQFRADDGRPEGSEAPAAPPEPQAPGEPLAATPA